MKVHAPRPGRVMHCFGLAVLLSVFSQVGGRLLSQHAVRLWFFFSLAAWEKDYNYFGRGGRKGGLVIWGPEASHDSNHREKSALVPRKEEAIERPGSWKKLGSKHTS